MRNTISEVSAGQLLKMAVELDKEAKYGEAVTCYEQGMRLLVQASKEVLVPSKKEHFRKKIDEYLARVEVLKTLRIEQVKQQLHTQIIIPKDATGYGYAKVFGPYLSSELTNVLVRDPYIRKNRQLHNLMHFCETLLSRAPNLETIHLVTSQDISNVKECQHQSGGLEELRSALALRDVALSYSISEALHDREVKFNNGWTIQMGRGLDYFQPLEGGRFSMGSGDYDLRLCQETTIDIFHQNSVTTTGTS